MIDPLKQSPTAAAPADATAAVKSLTTPTATTTAAPKATGLAAAAGLASPTPAAPKLDDSVSSKVTALTSQDSPLMQQARTDGLKVANRRGLLNSSMAVGASQDAALRTALPIAAQEASQAFQKNMQASDQSWRSGESQLDRDQQTSMQDKDIASQEGMAKAQRDLQEKMQGVGIEADKQAQIRDIASREGLAAAERALQEVMQGRDIASREGLAAADRNLQQQMQQTEIGYQTTQRGLDRALQEQLASWNLKSADRNAAAQFLTNMEGMYQDNVSSIMANTALDGPTREKMLANAQTLRNYQLSFVEQMYVIDLKW